MIERQIMVGIEPRSSLKLVVDFEFVAYKIFKQSHNNRQSNQIVHITTSIVTEVAIKDPLQATSFLFPSHLKKL